MRVIRGRGRVGTHVSVKSRLGTVSDKTRGGISVKSRLGIGRGVSKGHGSPRPAIAAALTNTPITDARQKININRVISGRVGDAREKIEIKRSKRVQNQIQQQLSGITLSGMRSVGRGVSEFRSPVKTLKITTSNSSPGSSGLFRNAVSSMGESSWTYVLPTRSPASSGSSTTMSTILTRTIKNPQARYQTTPAAFTSSFRRMGSVGGGMYSTPRSTIAKVAPISSRRGMGVSSHRYKQDDSDEEDDAMEVEDSPPPPPPVIRTSVKSRLDAPSKHKVKVSNLQTSVTTDDIMELFADVGDLVSARVFGSGLGEAYYKTKADCLKAIEAYHNRLLDGSPMKVVLAEEGKVQTTAPRATGIISSLKSAGGATMKIPKSIANPNVKIHPDISAIHKVLFQPSSSSNSTKMLFNKGN